MPVPVSVIATFLLIGFQAVTGVPFPASVLAGATVGAPTVEEAVPGRELDARVAIIAFRLAQAGRARCPALEPSPGLVLQHLAQFRVPDRRGVIAAWPLDRGAGVIVAVPGGPAAAAGVHAGDVVLAVNDVPLPPDPGGAAPFEAARAHARADAVDDLLAHPAPLTMTLLRDGATVTVRLVPRAVCPSRVRLARSDQRNAYADGRHVFMTTGLLARLGNDDELAFVLAHEMAHNILGHAAAMRRGDVRHGAGRTVGRSGDTVRAAERAADTLAGELMLDAGFDPVIGAAALRRAGGIDLRIGLLADHDSTGDRIAAMRALVAARRDR